VTEPAWDAARIGREFYVSRESLEKLAVFHDHLLAWQKRINLIAPSTTGHIWGRHIADSLQLARLLPRRTNVIADLGSGAGFPGLVLAIAAGQTAHLFESTGKKAAFLREAARATGVHAIVHQTRIESADRAMIADAVTARALAPLTMLLEYSFPWLERGAVGLFLKGQDVDAELIEATKSWSFDYKRHESLTDSGGAILEIANPSRKAQ
jgi:16S rRNA (guanine527-N7)-methyltransferase